MKIVKLSINSPKEGLLRQTPNNDGVWGNYKFFINEDVNECDYWVVYSKGQKKDNTSFVSPENLIFITGEPETIYHYSKKFVNKFNTVITIRKDITAPHIINMHPAQPWWVGRKMKRDGTIEFVMDFKELKQSPKKKKLISVITSNKAYTKGHKERIRFVQQLKNHFGEQLDVYGKGFNPFEDKWDVLKDYKYHIVIENSSYPDYWTEKLGDSFLAETFPFYYGCTNLDKYFPQKSFKLIDITNANNSIQIIEEGLKDDLYAINRQFLLEAKQRVLNKHNIFSMITSVCDQLDLSSPKKEITIKHEMAYFDLYKIPLLLKRLYYKYLY